MLLYPDCMPHHLEQSFQRNGTGPTGDVAISVSENVLSSASLDLCPTNADQRHPALDWTWYSPPVSRRESLLTRSRLKSAAAR